MGRNHLARISLLIFAVHCLVDRSEAQPVRMPSPVQPPPPSTLPYTTPAAPFPTAPSAVVYPPPAMPSATQPQAVQNLVGDAQRYGLPFDPYAQPAQYVAPPAAVPYTATPPPAAAPPFTWPTLPTSWGGFYAGADGTILEARTGTLSFPTSQITLGGVGGVGGTIIGNDMPPEPDIDSIDFEPDFDFEFSPRVWAGYKGAAGFGVRGRWWYYKHSGAGNFDIENLTEGSPVDLNGIGAGDSLSLSLESELRMNVLDLEGTQDGQFHNWDFQVSGGARFARIDYDLTGTITGTFDGPPTPPGFTHLIAANSDFSGVGPTIAFSGRRPIVYLDGLAFLVNFRMAFLFGDSAASFADADGVDVFPDAVDFEDSVQAWEAQIGFEYSRQLASGARLFGGAYLEGQIWEWGFPTGITGNDIGFFGPTVTVGIAR